MVPRLIRDRAADSPFEVGMDGTQMKLIPLGPIGTGLAARGMAAP
jgi:hypothetical protein